VYVAKREITKAQLEELLASDPNVTFCALKKILRCGSDTLSRELSKHGLGTKPWSERTHSLETKGKISEARKGKILGDKNPNFGAKYRPWLEVDNHPLRKWHVANPDFGDKQRGLKNPVHKARELYDNPEYVRKITSGIREHVASKKGRTYEEVYGEERASDYKRKLREASPSRMAKFSRKVTWPEATDLKNNPEECLLKIVAEMKRE
jgi:hypothetical protein